MQRIIVVLLSAALIFSGPVTAISVTPAYADFEAPPPPPPPPPADAPQAQSQQDQPKPKKKRFRISKKTALKIAVCTGGKVILKVGEPLPLEKMSKRQWARYQIEVDFYNRAKIAWGLGCGFAPNPGAGVVIGAGVIAGMDFHSRFIAGTRPIKRTKRQEADMFCRDGTSPCPDRTGVDPDLYGPA